ncbi:MAG: XRE family transcriptional regulator, partial [Chitinophagia bacterium]|nr:XRE family transcriptional regulator [Chitinophagia bacterium]
VKKKITRKLLAQLIGTSPSYLTQVFRGDKPLNFMTLAKIQKALNVSFVTRLYFKDK